MEVLSRFLEQYIKEIDFYERASKLCAQICESEIERSGIRAIVTYRAKRPDKLKDKLLKRNTKIQYSSIGEIYEDIVDLAGVRIAIYFPGDKEEIEKFIISTFDVEETKEFPVDLEPNGSKGIYKKIFSGYHATHYRVRLKPELCAEDEKKYCNALIEIQIATVLMHAWAEVEHDLVYKPLSGQLSRDEYEILDELNGLILSGEIALKRLQKAVNDRVSRQSVPFNNHYELAAFLYNKVQETLGEKAEEMIMGRADILFNFLKIAGMDKPEQLNKYLQNIGSYNHNNIVEYVIEQVLGENPDLYSVYLKSRNSSGNRNPYSETEEIQEQYFDRKAITYFITRWVGLMQLVKQFISNYSIKINGSRFDSPKLLYEAFKNSEGEKKAEVLQELRNQLIHGNRMPTDNQLMEAGKIIDDLTEILNNKLKETDDILAAAGKENGKNASYNSTETK